MPIDDDPTICKQKLAAFLLRTRLAVKLSREEAAARARVSTSQLIRFEGGKSTITINNLKPLLEVYKVDVERWPELEAWSEASRRRSTAQQWWHEYRAAVSAEFDDFLTYENWATTILNFEPHLVPGLLQTPAYAKAVTETIVPRDKVDNVVKLRLQRQTLFKQRSHLEEAAFILDENVLHRLVGNAAVMREQLHELIQAMKQPNVRIDVLPFSHGLYPRWFESYVVFRLPSQDPPYVLFLEDPHADMLIKQKPRNKKPEQYSKDFKKLQEIAAAYDPVETIRRLISEIPSGRSG
jgi:transcriptional regulator with XRE-family HTH domain